jgi:hypothetical protein
MRDLAKELELSGYPPAWLPQAGEILVGTIEGYDTGKTKWGPYRTCIIQNELTGAKVSIWLWHLVLQKLFDEAQPSVGERIGVQYLGKHETKDYHRYRLMVDRPVTEAV